MSEKKYCSHPKWLKLGLLRIRDSWPILLGGFTWRSALGAPPRAKNCERCHFQLFLLLAIFRHPYFVWALSNEQFWINIKQDIKWISGQDQTFNGDEFKNIDEAIGIQAGPSEQKEIWANIALRLSRHKNLYFNFIFSTLSTSLFTYMSTTSHNKGCSYETRKNESISWLSCERPNRSLQPLFFLLTHHQPHYPPPADRICKVIHSDWITRHNQDHLAKIFRSQHLDLGQVLLDPERGEARKGVLEPALVHHLQKTEFFEVKISFIEKEENFGRPSQDIAAECPPPRLPRALV